MNARIPLKMNKQQRKVLDDEVKKHILAEDKKFAMESDANVLFTLYNDFNFSKEELLRFWNVVYNNHQELIERYEMSSNEETGWLYKRF